MIKRLYTDLKVPFAMVGDTRVDDTAVHVALREALVNTLIHADYAGTCSVLIVKRPDLFGFRNPGILRIPREDVLRGGNSDCRNRHLQKMFQMVGLGEQAGSGVPKIYQSWKSQHWKQPKLEERVDTNQTVLAMEMASLVPDGAVDELKGEFGEDFDHLDEAERLAMVTALTEGCVTHRRLKELTREHPHDLSLKLHSLVDRGMLNSDGFSRSTFYYLPGRHPIKDADLGVSAPPSVESSVHSEATPRHNGVRSVHKESTTRASEARLEAIAKSISCRRRASPEEMKRCILALCATRDLSIAELGRLLKRSQETLRTHYVSPMCEEGILSRRHPNILHHPSQKYRTVRKYDIMNIE